MRKFILTVAIAVLATISASAQFVLSAGYTRGTTKFTYNELGTTSKTISNGGFVMGSYAYHFNGEAYLSGGLRMNLVGWQESGSFVINNGTMLAAEIPLMIGTATEVASEIKLGISVGPTFQVGLMANEKIYDKAGIFKADWDCYANNEFKRCDLFLGANAYLEFFEKGRLFVGYDLGLLNTSTTNSVTRKTNRLNVGLSYLF